MYNFHNNKKKHTHKQAFCLWMCVSACVYMKENKGIKIIKMNTEHFPNRCEQFFNEIVYVDI